MMRSILAFIIISVVTINFGCKKDAFITEPSANIELSTDTVTFDTIFTTIGSVTRIFKIRNPHNEDIKIASIYLAGGNASNFRLNIDGTAANEVKNVRIPKKDSLFIFVEVTLDPVNDILPLIVRDSVIIVANGNVNNVKLIAFGQDVHLIDGEVLETQTWVNDKPYLIYNSMGVDTGAVLTIEEGVKVYLHDYSGIYVWGQLLVEGTPENPVIFEGDRFDRGYDKSAGRWGFIYIDPMSTGNIIDHAIIKNPTVGLWVGHYFYDETPQIQVSNSMILNAAAHGIIALGADMMVYNTIIADCNNYAVAITKGGTYNFYHCTISNQGAYYADDIEGFYRGRANPSIVLMNYFEEYIVDSTYNIVREKFTKDLTEANFVNSIITGTRYTKNEIFAKEYEEEQLAFNFHFDHCLIKNVADSVIEQFGDNFTNWTDSLYANFVNDSLLNGEYDFHLDSLSPAQNAGDPSVFDLYPFLRYDLNGNPRDDDEAPDLGALERKED